LRCSTAGVHIAVRCSRVVRRSFVVTARFRLRCGRLPVRRRSCFAGRCCVAGRISGALLAVLVPLTAAAAATTAPVT
jgi:hypothetical protein